MRSPADQIKYHERRIETLRAKAQPTFRYARQAARALDRAIESMVDESGRLRDGGQEMHDAFVAALDNLRAYYEPIGAYLLPGDNHEQKE